MKNSFKRAGLLATAAVAFGLAAPAFADDIKIGALMPLTGQLQELTPPILNGAKLAVEEANAAGGVMGKTVVLEVKDTQLNPQVANDAAQKLVSVDGAVGSVGPLASGITAAVANTVTINAKHPIVSPSATAPTITDLDDNDFVFRTTASDAYQGVALAQLMAEKGSSKVAVIYVNNDYGVGLAKSLEEAMSLTGGTVTGKVAYEPKSTSYRGELSKLAEGGAEELVVVGYPADGGIDIVRQALEEGFFGKFVFTDGMKAQGLIDNIGGANLAGSYGTAPRGVETDASKGFADMYSKKFGADPSGPYIHNNYDAAMILMLGIEKAGSTDGAAVRDGMRAVANAPGEIVGPGEFAKAKELLAAGKDINYEGAAGAQDFDENGDVAGTFEHWEIKDDALVTVKIF